MPKQNSKGRGARNFDALTKYAARHEPEEYRVARHCQDIARQGINLLPLSSDPAVASLHRRLADAIRDYFWKSAAHGW
jgi:hypothetical protein